MEPDYTSETLHIFAIALVHEYTYSKFTEQIIVPTLQLLSMELLVTGPRAGSDKIGDNGVHWPLHSKIIHAVIFRPLKDAGNPQPRRLHQCLATLITLSFSRVQTK